MHRLHRGKDTGWEAAPGSIPSTPRFASAILFLLLLFIIRDNVSVGTHAAMGKVSSQPLLAWISAEGTGAGSTHHPR